MGATEKNKAIQKTRLWGDFSDVGERAPNLRRNSYHWEVNVRNVVTDSVNKMRFSKTPFLTCFPSVT